MTPRRTAPWRRVLVAGLAGLLAATSCGGADEPDAPGDGAAAVDGSDEIDEIGAAAALCPVDALGPTGPAVEIELWHAMSATTGVVLDDLVATYNAGQDRVHVTPVYQGGYRDNFNKYISTLRSGGDRPSMIQLNETSMQQMVDSQSIVAVENCVLAADHGLGDHPPWLLDQYRIDGVLVTMPFQLAAPVLYYDGNDFVAAGLDPDDPPATLVELEAVSTTLVASGVVPSALALDVDAWPFEQWVNTAGVPLVDNDNGRSGRAERSLLDSTAVTDVLEVLARMEEAGHLQTTGRGGEQAALGKFLAVAFGDASMTIASSASLGEIYNQIDQVPTVDLRVGPFPGLSGGTLAVGGGSLYLTDDTSDAERAAVWDFMTWLNEPAQQVAWAAGTGYIPTRISATSDPDLQALWAERPGYRVAFDQLGQPGELAGGGGPVIGDFLGFRDAIEDGLEAMYAGTDPATTQAQMVEAANEAIGEYNRRIGE
ncbi:MAG: ABC transporter substrate-binding protein [Acidimicrobiia bacterium]|nr:ABC transporter substrate-binding protein [Acidimicrobiia bacterium]